MGTPGTCPGLRIFLFEGPWSQVVVGHGPANADSYASILKYHINQNQQQKQAQQPTMAQLYDIMKSDDLESTFLNTEVALRIHLTLIPTSCTGERSLSTMKIIKNHLRSCMLQPRLSALSF